GRPRRDHPLDLNRATGADLAQLPGIGPRLSDRILRQRALLGGEFRSPDDLAIVPGLGARRAGLLRPLVTVTPRWRAPTESDLPDSGPPAGPARAHDLARPVARAQRSSARPSARRGPRDRRPRARWTPDAAPAPGRARGRRWRRAAGRRHAARPPVRPAPVDGGRRAGQGHARPRR